MARYRFGVGEYKCFAAPLPGPVAALRTELYRRLAPVANRWMETLGSAERYPSDLGTYLARCAAHGQTRPTPLLLRYTAGGYNCLHQDLYGALAFPFQVTCVLSRVDADYTGGEILLVEQRPRAQSREPFPLWLDSVRYRSLPCAHHSGQTPSDAISHH